LEHSLKFSLINLIRVINVNLIEEILQTLARLLESLIHFTEYSLLESQYFIWNTIVTLFSLSLILIKLDLIATEDSQKLLIVNASFLVLPEVIYELLDVIVINS
jgi:hypothetical protein